MPRYYFDVCDGDGLTQDDDGLLLDSPDSARSEGLAALMEIARDMRPTRNMAISITVRTTEQVAVFVGTLTLTAQG
jgi:hypothetical protein